MKLLSILKNSYNSNRNNLSNISLIGCTLTLIINKTEAIISELKYPKPKEEAKYDYWWFNAKLTLPKYKKLKIEIIREDKGTLSRSKDPYESMRFELELEDCKESVLEVGETRIELDYNNIGLSLIDLLHFDTVRDNSRINSLEISKPKINVDVYINPDDCFKKRIEELYSISYDSNTRLYDNSWVLLTLAVIFLLEDIMKNKTSLTLYPSNWNFTIGENYGDSEIFKIENMESEARDLSDNFKVLRSDFKFQIYKIQNHLCYLSYLALNRYYKVK